MRRLVDDLAPRSRRSARAAGPRRGAPSRARQAAAARARRARCSIPGSPFLELSPLAAHGMYDDEVPAAGHHHRHRPGRGPRMRDRRQRRHGQGRHLLSDDGEEASARAGDRAAEPPALHLSGRFRRRQPAATRPRSFPTASISAASSTTRPTCRPQGIPQIAVVMGSCTAGGAYVPAMSDESDHRARPGHDLPRRAAAGEGRDRRGGDAPRISAAPTCTAGISGVADHMADDDAHALAHRAPHRRQPQPRQAARPRRAPSRASRSTTRRSSTASIPADPRKPYDVREVIARLVDGSELDEFKHALRHDAGHRLRAHLRLSGRHRRQQRHPVLGSRR